jgi:ectoine hydroxylase-related dioxygenase (phytanoyl-CoA dioxygenase family)
VRASHKNAILPHKDTFDDRNLLSRGQEVRVDVEEADKVAIELEPGQISLHHGLTIHGSGPNVSDDRRIACVIRYIRPDMEQSAGGKDPAVLVRGQDRFGNFMHTRPPQDYFEPEALALYEDIRRAQAAVLMKGAAGKAEMYT